MELAATLTPGRAIPPGTGWGAGVDPVSCVGACIAGVSVDTWSAVLLAGLVSLVLAIGWPRLR